METLFGFIIGALVVMLMKGHSINIHIKHENVNSNPVDLSKLYEDMNSKDETPKAKDTKEDEDFLQMQSEMQNAHAAILHEFNGTEVLEDEEQRK